MGRLVAIGVLLGGCFSPSFRNGDILCKTDDQCPPSLHCSSAGSCWKNGTDPMLDLSVPSTNDAGGPCTTANDCSSHVCNQNAHTCLPATCNDGAKNGNETDLDCGGGMCPQCGNLKSCQGPSDCQSNICSPQGLCVSAQCSDQMRDGNETDLDCGGGSCPPCAPTKSCAANSDCASKICDPSGHCAAPTCSDTVQNGNETAVDCGGGMCPTCADLKSCRVAADCMSGVCSAQNLCVSAQCSDHVQNGNETDLDCGGGSCPACDANQSCKANSDCTSMLCDGTMHCTTPTCSDGVLNNGETARDCGGSNCDAQNLKCATDQACSSGADCQNGICNTTCQAPTCYDGVQNGNELGVDCGGSDCDPLNKRCADGTPCGGNSDCKSLVCSTTCQRATCGDAVLNGTETATDCGGPACDSLNKLCADGAACSSGHDCQSGICNVTCQPGSCNNGSKDGTETAKDCGGPVCDLLGKTCGPGAVCSRNADCWSRICNTTMCADVSCSDSIQNGDETDVDCGGSVCGKCANLQRCLSSSDCSSGVCTALKVCAPAQCNNGMKDVGETDIDCGGSSCPKCPEKKHCGVAGDCINKDCAAGTCNLFTLKYSYGLPYFTGTVTGGSFSSLNDTNTDVFIIYSSTAQEFLGAGNGTFSTSTALTNATCGSIGNITAGDINHDGKMDLVTSCQTSPSVETYLGNGDGTFQTGTNLTVPLGPLVTARDLNGDLNDDVITANSIAGSASVLLANSSGVFAVNQTYSLPGNPFDVAIADMDHDGILDAIFPIPSVNGVVVMLGTGSGAFNGSALQTLSVSPAPQWVATGDFNGDGFGDVVTADPNETNMEVILYTPTFQVVNTIPTGATPKYAAIGDFNSDGRLDIAVANQGDSTVGIALGNGDGTFQSTFTIATDMLPQSIFVADFNKDGKPDLAVSADGSYKLDIFLNNSQ